MKLTGTVLRFVFALLSVSSCSQAQETVMFIRGNKIVSTLDSAEFTRIVKPDSAFGNYQLVELYKDNTRRAIGRVTGFSDDDPSLIQYDGTVTWFYPDGKRKESIIFDKGEPKASGMFYYPGNRLKMEVNFNNGIIPFRFLILI